MLLHCDTLLLIHCLIWCANILLNNLASISFVFFFLDFQDRVSLCVTLAVLEFKLASNSQRSSSPASQVLGLQALTTTAWPSPYFQSKEGLCLFFVVVVVIIFHDRICLCTLGCHGSHSVDTARIKVIKIQLLLPPEC